MVQQQMELEFFTQQGPIQEQDDSEPPSSCDGGNAQAAARLQMDVATGETQHNQQGASAEE